MSVLGWCFLAAGAVVVLVAAGFWVSAPIRAVHRKSRPSASGGGKSAGYAHGPGSGRAAEASGSGSPTAADNGSGGRFRA